jgi:hypothetical protein
MCPQQIHLYRKLLLFHFLLMSVLVCSIPLIPSRSYAQSRVVLRGVVYDAFSREVLRGASVTISHDSIYAHGDPERRSSLTNTSGLYSIEYLLPGTYFLHVRHQHYQAYLAKIIVTDSAAVQQNIYLTPFSSRFNTILIEGQQYSQKENAISSVEITRQMISTVPATFGEADVTKILQLMPGIKSSSEASSGLYIRGGSPDQNLILLDGIPVYNPAHLGGIFSTFNSDALSDVRVIKGVFPAEYGGRLSGVVDVSIRDGTHEKISGKVNVGLIASRLLLEGPITDNATFMLSARRTYFELPIAAIKAVTTTPELPQYYFYDLNAKVSYAPSDNDKLVASAYTGGDVFLYTSADTTLRGNLAWGNTIANIRWTHMFSPSVLTTASAYYSSFLFSSDIDAKVSSSLPFINALNLFSQIRDIGARAEAQYFHSDEHTAKAGVEAIYHRFLTLTDSFGQNIVGYINFLDASRTVSAFELAAYLQDQWSITPSLDATVGLRTTYFAQGNRFRIEPRVALSWIADDNLAVKGAVGVTNQFLHLVSRNDVTILPTDAWFPSTVLIKPAQSVQYELGAETHLWEKEVFLSVQGYYKSLSHLYEFRDDARFTLLTPAEILLTEGKGEAYGAEIFLHKRMGVLKGWIGYTLAWTWRTFPELNGGRPFAPRYDRRHDVSLVASYTLSDAWEIGATWTYGTGQAFTLPAAQYNFSLTTYQGAYFNAYPQIQYTERNGGRLPPFHKLDVSITHRFQWWNLPFQASLSVYNVYNRYNAFSWSVDYQSFFSTAYSTAWTGNIKQVSLLGIVPTLNLSVQF